MLTASLHVKVAKKQSKAPAALRLKIGPSCHTRSKALLMSQTTVRTSLPASSASVKMWYKYASWLLVTVESPGMKADCPMITC